MRLLVLGGTAWLGSDGRYLLADPEKEGSGP